MHDSQPLVPYHRSFLLNKLVYLDKLGALTADELTILNVETLASLHEARHNLELCEDKQSEESGNEFRRMKIAGYFQAAIKIELEKR